MPGRTVAAKRYAEAVAAIARQENSWDDWRRELNVVRETLQDPALRLELESPRKSAGQRREIIDRTFGGRISPPTLNLLKVMARRGRFNLFEDLLVWFDEISDRAMGVRRYTVTSATPLTDAERQRLRERLGTRGQAGGQLILTEKVDPSLIGGMVLQQDDIIRDYSIKTRLATLRERLN